MRIFNMAKNDENEGGVEVPQKYIDMLDNKTVSAEMLDAACYTYNKIAKNYRDEGDPWSRDECYAKKDTLISAVEPICIHKETYEYSCEIHQSTDSDYEKFKPDFDSERTFRNKDTGETVNIGVIERKEEISEPRYYLFYDFGGEHTYHHPLWNGPGSDDLAKYPVREIDVLHTHGADVNTLLPMSFCDKVVDLVKSGDYTFIPADNLFEKILSHEDSINERNAANRKENFEYNVGDPGQCGKFEVESRVEKFENLPVDMRTAINESNLPYGIESLILDNSDYFTADDIRDASKIEHDEKDPDGPWKADTYMERMSDFLKERYTENYADTVSADHRFDSEQGKIVKEYGHTGNRLADIAEFSDSVATLLNLGMTEEEVDAVLTDGDDNIIYSPGQSVVITDAYRDGMPEDKIDVLKSVCNMNHDMEGSDLEKISECLSHGTDAETASAALSVWDCFSDRETASHNIDSFVVPCLEGKMDINVLERIVDVLPKNEYGAIRMNDYGEIEINSHPAGEVIENFLSAGHTPEEFEKVISHIIDKEGTNEATVYLDAYGRGVNPELLDVCMEGSADRSDLERILDLERNGTDSNCLKDNILDKSGNVNFHHITDIELASKGGLSKEQTNLVIEINDQYNPGDHAPNEIVFAVADGISEEDIKSYLKVINDNEWTWDDESGLFEKDQDYAMACCRIELGNGDDIGKVLDDLNTWINDDRCSDEVNFDKIVGYDYEGKEMELPDRWDFEHYDYYDVYNENSDEDYDEYDEDYSEPLWDDPDWEEVTDTTDERKEDVQKSEQDISRILMEKIAETINETVSDIQRDDDGTDDDACRSENDNTDKDVEMTYNRIDDEEDGEDCDGHTFERFAEE